MVVFQSEKADENSMQPKKPARFRRCRAFARLFRNDPLGFFHGFAYLSGATPLPDIAVFWKHRQMRAFRLDGLGGAV